VAEFDRWAAPLKESVTRLLAENLATRLPTDRIAVFPWARAMSIDHEVEVEVMQFEGTLGADCVLVARWQIVGNAEKTVIVTGNSSYTEPAGGDYASLVAIQSRLIAALGRDIASALTGVAR
jgi:uncharacterized lipoprotein YmbA